MGLIEVGTGERYQTDLLSVPQRPELRRVRTARLRPTVSHKGSGIGAAPTTLRGRAGRRVSRRGSRLVRWPAVALLAVGGCRSIGPSTVSRDRVDYSTAVAESWKRQALLNIVKVRYMDTPIFVDVGQIVSGYSLETGLSAAAAGFPYANTDQLQVQGSTKFTDRPTITYVPLTGNRFIAGPATSASPICPPVVNTISAALPTSATV